METNDAIVEKILRRFGTKQSRWNNQTPRIMFWVDSDKNFSEKIDDPEFISALGDIEIIKYNKYRALEDKIRIEHDISKKFLIYVYDALPPESENILADMVHYSGDIFYADRASLLCLDLGISTKKSPLLNNHLKFFDSKIRIEKFRSRDVNLEDDEEIICGMISVVIGSKSIEIGGLLRDVLLKYSDTMSIDSVSDDFERLKSYNLFVPFWQMISSEFGFILPEGDGDPSLGDLIRVLFVSYFANSVNIPLSGKLKDSVSEKKRRIATFVNGMYKSEDYSKAAESMSKSVSELLKIKNILDSVSSIESFADSDAFPCIDEIIIIRLARHIDDAAAPMQPSYERIVDKRKKLHYYGNPIEHFGSMYDIIEHGNEMLKCVNAFSKSLSAQLTAKDLLKSYSQMYYLVDYHYRKFINSYNGLPSPIAEIEELYELIENKYSNIYLKDICSKLSSLVKSYDDLGNNRQTDFYRRNIRSDRSTVVIVSDALRYECVAEILEKLKSNSNVENQPVLDYVVSTIPSITEFGMPALLPNNGLEVNLDQGCSININGMSTESQDREKILLAKNPKSVKLTFADVYDGLSRDELREKCKGKEVIYIYHNVVDNRGEHEDTTVFDACEKAIRDMLWAISILPNKFNKNRFIITSDHGFIYRKRKLEEMDKILTGGVKANRRHVLSEGHSNIEQSVEFTLDYLGPSNKNLFVSVPSTNKIYKVAGASQNFVHGGMSPQEIVVPVLCVDTKQDHVDQDYVQIQSSREKIITKRNPKIKLWQMQPVSKNYLESKFELWFENIDGGVISDHKIIVANKVEGDEMLITTTFSISGEKRGTAYLNIKNLSKEGSVPEKEEYTIRIMLDSEDLGW